MVRRVTARYAVHINKTGGAPHMIRFENIRPGSDVASSAQELAIDIRKVVSQAVSRYTGWTTRQSKNRVRGILSASGERGFSTGDDVQNLNILDGDFLLDILERIQVDGSNPNITFWLINWDFWIIPPSITGGDSKIVKKPKWHNSVAYSQTWKGYEDEDGDISCAAFAICWGLYSSNKSKHYERIYNAIRDARELMEEMEWGTFVTVFELQKFVQHYPTKKLVLINPFAIQAIASYSGKNFDADAEEVDLIKNTIFLTYDPTQEHYGGIRNPAVIIGNAHGKCVGKNNSQWKWCHRCDEGYRWVVNGNNPKHGCRDGRVYEQKRKPRTCGSCGLDVIGACYSCDGRDCKGCGSKYKNNTYHRCLFMTRKALNSHFENEDLDLVEEEEKDDFFKYPENEYRILFADLESAMHRVVGTQEVIEKFNFTEDGKYVCNNILTPPIEGEEPCTVALYSYTHIEQRANYCYVEDGCDDSVQKMFKGDRCLDEFLDWVTSYNDGKNIVLFHYGSGYDARLIFAAAHKKFKTELKSPIIRGTKFLELKIGNAIFRDSILHLPGSLDSLGKAFSPPGGLVKGHFPILFNFQENVGKVFDTIPDLEWFAVPRDKKAYEDLKAWHQSWEGEWDFSKEIEKYVIADVKVLKYVGMEFHKTLVAATGGSPWYRATAPSFTHEFLKVKVTKLMNLPKFNDPDYSQAIQDRVHDFWPVLEPYEDSFARKCLRGGRTDVKCMRRYLTAEEIERGCRIKYIDVNSMYPGVQMSKDFPVGLPQIEIYDINYVPCRNHENEGKCGCILLRRKEFPKFKYQVLEPPSSEEILNDETFFGFGVFTTIPPKEIFTPITVTYSEKEKKCLATLRDEDHVEKYDTSETLKMMLKNGYKLVKIHAFHRYKKAESIWKRAGFGDLILQKMIVSAHAPVSLEERAYLEKVYEERFQMGNAVRESWDKWCPNKAKKIIYKVVINSAWGKHVQKLIQSECEVFNSVNDLDSIKAFWSNVLSGKYKFKSGLFLSGGSVVQRFEKNRDLVKLDLHNCYTPAAIFVPEYGRIQLVEKLLELKEPLYHDTDSVICFHDPDIHEPLETSDILGDWGEEDISLESEHGGIVEFVAMGPKTYGLKCRDGYTSVKAKGIRMNYATEDIFNFEVMKYMVDQYIDNDCLKVVEVFFLFLILDSFYSNDF